MGFAVWTCAAAVVLGCAVCAYEVPEVRIEVMRPKGFIASIPDAPGIGLFSFNANVNGALNSPDVGSVSGEVLETEGGRWTFRDDSAELKPGDTLHYWVMVAVNRLGYVKDKLSFRYDGSSVSGEVLETERGRWTFRDDSAELKPGDTLHYWVMVAVNRLGYVKDNLSFEYDGKSGPSGSPSPGTPTPAPTPTAAPASCGATLTTVRGRAACAGQVVFEDNFDQLTGSWQIEQKIPNGHPEYPFVSYQNLASVVGVGGGTLKVTPTLLQTLPPYSIEAVRSGTLDLFRGCTEAAEGCYMAASGSDILPPVVSGRANTKYGFTFRYGTVDVRAKLPRGDWLYPEILLEPVISKYGREQFSSGVVKVAMARGNTELRLGDVRIGNSRLYGGALLDRFQCHDNMLYSKVAVGDWGEEFHNYSVRWEPDRMIWSVDGQEYGRLNIPDGGLRANLQNCSGMSTVFERWALGGKNAPFDEEFYVTLGVAAGGITEFPDAAISSLGRGKPWQSRSSKAKLNFWLDAERWYRTWGENAALLVDSVRVTAL